MKLPHISNVPLQPGNLSNTSLDQETSVNCQAKHQPTHIKETNYYSIEMSVNEDQISYKNLYTAVPVRD